MVLKINQQAPDFTLPSTNGTHFNLSKDAIGKPCILFFYPKDFTPGCTKESCGFRDIFNFFQKLQIEVYGISGDNLETHHKFKEANKLPFHLLSDEKGDVAKKYGAMVPFLNFRKRITYLLDKDHKIKAAYSGFFRASIHVEEMIKAL